MGAKRATQGMKNLYILHIFLNSCRNFLGFFKTNQGVPYNYGYKKGLKYQQTENFKLSIKQIAFLFMF